MTGGVHLEAVAGSAALAVAYALAWRRAGERASPARAVAFASALAGVVVALNGPLHELADGGRFSAHMLQHLVFTLVVPPLLLAGTPSFMADALLAPPLEWPPTRRLLDAVTRPLTALGLWSTALFAWHLPGPYAAAVGSHAVHFAQHATLVAAALLAWWPILSPSRRLPALPYAAQLLYLFAFGMPMTIVAAMITGAEQTLYPPAPLADQRLGGVLMWVPSAVVPLTAFTAVFFRWAAAESEDRHGANAFPE
jgi:putative membrane protein